MMDEFWRKGKRQRLGFSHPRSVAKQTHHLSSIIIQASRSGLSRIPHGQRGKPLSPEQVQGEASQG